MSGSATSTNLQLSSPVYDQLKKVVQVLLPGVGTLYFSLAQIWGLPAAEEVVGTCTAIALFLGLALQFSSKGYSAEGQYSGAIEILPTETGGKTYSLNLNDSPEALDGKKEVKFRVDNFLE